MADKRISELTAATTVAPSDVTVVVQSGITKKLPFSVLIENAVNQKFVDIETVTATGFTASLNTATVFNSAVNITGTLPQGSAQTAQIKYLTNSNTGIVSVTCTGQGFSTITLPGNSLVKLVWLNSKWWIESNNGVTYG